MISNATTSLYLSGDVQTAVTDLASAVENDSDFVKLATTTQPSSLDAEAYTLSYTVQQYTQASLYAAAENPNYGQSSGTDQLISTVYNASGTADLLSAVFNAQEKSGENVDIEA